MTFEQLGQKVDDLEQRVKELEDVLPGGTKEKPAAAETKKDPRKP